MPSQLRKHELKSALQPYPSLFTVTPHSQHLLSSVEGGFEGDDFFHIAKLLSFGKLLVSPKYG